MAKTQVFYRLVKAQPGHKFAGLYAVEKVYIRGNEIYKKEIVHEWDLRILSEGILSKLGGDSAYVSYVEDNPVEDTLEQDHVAEAKAREAADLADMTQRKLNRELTGEIMKISSSGIIPMQLTILVNSQPLWASYILI